MHIGVTWCEVCSWCDGQLSEKQEASSCTFKPEINSRSPLLGDGDPQSDEVFSRNLARSAYWLGASTTRRRRRRRRQPCEQGGIGRAERFRRMRGGGCCRAVARLMQ